MAHHKDIISLVVELRHKLAAFSRSRQVSPVEMVGLAGMAVLYIGIELERVAGLEARPKSFEVPLSSELIDIVADFGKRSHVTPVEMIAVLGATIIDLGALIETEVNSQIRLN